MTVSDRVVRLIGPPQADGEYIVLRTGAADGSDGAGGSHGADGSDGSDEDIVHLHDYERIYGVPGLYEHVVQDLLGCRSPQTAVDGLARALSRLGVDPADVVLLDVGAGTGIVGELAHDLGVRTLIGVDSLGAGRTACLRDRGRIYHDYLVGDLAAPSPELTAQLRRHRPTALISAGAFGGTHAPPAALRGALTLLPAGAPVVFTIDERWMESDGPGGFRTPMRQLLDSAELRLLDRSRFQHRLSTAGVPIHYELVIAAKGSDQA